MKDRLTMAILLALASIVAGCAMPQVAPGVAGVPTGYCRVNASTSPPHDATAISAAHRYLTKRIGQEPDAYYRATPTDTGYHVDVLFVAGQAPNGEPLFSKAHSSVTVSADGRATDLIRW